MKKILLVLMLIFVVGCSSNTPRNTVEVYLKKYKTLDSEVLLDLESIIKKENLTNDQEEKYREILKKQYKDLSFKILEEEYDDEVSYVTVKIEVYDLYKAGSDAPIYLENNQDKFLNENNEYDVNKFIDYKLERMKNTTKRVDYTITITTTKENGKYEVVDLTDNDLKKIHGIYNYELT